MQKKLTTKTLDALPPSKGKRYEVRDALLPGLHIRVSSAGRKVWYLSTRVNQRMRRIKIGAYPIVPLSDARDKARTILKDVQLGTYDVDAVEVERVLTLGEIIPQFIELYARDRVLSSTELMACWSGAEAEGYPFEQFTKLLILTGQRRGEVAGMRWSEIDFNTGTWTIPAKRAKNATSHTVPLAPLALDILKSTPRFLSSDLVLTTNGTTPISGFGRLKQRLDLAVGTDAEDWRIHDIRRTVATNMAMIGVQPHIIEAVLNHKTGIVSGVAATYNRHAYLICQSTLIG